jgi:uncharacterized membrane protein
MKFSYSTLLRLPDLFETSGRRISYDGCLYGNVIRVGGNMAQLLGKIIFAIVACVLVAAVLTLAVGLFGTLIGLVGLVIKLAVIAGLIYVVWLIFKKLTESTA